MKLLIITQKVNKNDPVLGFFHEWILRLAKKADKLTVICLEKGEYDLPPNVEVLSLGKEVISSKILYLWNFYKYIILRLNNYDGVFAHMNPEYVILGGVLWRLFNKKILLWYTHKAVNLKLRIAEKLAHKIFTASAESFRLPSKKVEVTGHGIPVEKFCCTGGKVSMREEIKLLSVGRVSPVKNLETVILGIMELHKRNVSGPRFTLSIVGSTARPEDEKYKQKLEETLRHIAAGTLLVHFKGPMSGEDLYEEYRSHHIFIHTSATGSLDKVVLEAMAAGLIVISSSEAFWNLAKDDLGYNFPQGDYVKLAETVEKVSHSGIVLPYKKAVDYAREHHNLDNIVNKLVAYFS